MAITELLATEFGLSNISIKTLDGYANANYLISSDEGKFTFKTYSNLKLQETVEAENHMLLHLKSKKINDIPEPVPFTDGTYSKLIVIGDGTRLCRLLTFVEGEFLGDRELNNGLVKSLGTYIANLNVALRDFDHMACRAKKSNWDLKYALQNKALVDIL